MEKGEKEKKGGMTKRAEEEEADKEGKAGGGERHGRGKHEEGWKEEEHSSKAQQRGQGARGGGVKRRRAREISVERPDAGQCGGRSCDRARGEEPNEERRQGGVGGDTAEAIVPMKRGKEASAEILVRL